MVCCMYTAEARERSTGIFASSKYSSRSNTRAIARMHLSSSYPGYYIMKPVLYNIDI